MATTADFKNGLVLKNEGKLQQIIEFQHVKPGKGAAFVRTKLKDVVTGKTVDKTFNACLLYTSPSPRDVAESLMPSSA